MCLSSPYPAPTRVVGSSRLASARVRRAYTVVPCVVVSLFLARPLARPLHRRAPHPPARHSRASPNRAWATTVGAAAAQRFRRWVAELLWRDDADASDAAAAGAGARDVAPGALAPPTEAPEARDDAACEIFRMKGVLAVADDARPFILQVAHTRGERSGQAGRMC